MQLLDTTVSRKQFRFRFENTWLKEPSFKEEVATYWRSLPATNILPKLLSVSAFMAKWGRTFFHKFRDEVKNQKMVLCNLMNREDDEGIKLYFEERERLNELLLHEEVYWKQRAKTFWLQEGDSNSKYFHAQASKRKRLNKIPYLMDDEGKKIETQEEMNVVTKEYFTKVFTDSSSNIAFDPSLEQAMVTDVQNEKLIADLSFDEFTEAVK